MRRPKRARVKRYGVAAVDSVPPAGMPWFSPAAIVGAPSVNAFKDEAQALLTVNAGTESGTPARCETWRAVLGPPPAWRAWPKIVSSIAAAGRPERSMAAFAATSPRAAADSDAEEPPNLPIGGLAAERAQTGRMRDGILELKMRNVRIGLTLGKDATKGEENDYIRALVEAGFAREEIEVIDPGMRPEGLFDGVVFAGGLDVDPSRYGEDDDHPTVELDLERDATEFAVFDQARRGAVPTLGICRWMQFISIAMVGIVHRRIPRQLTT